MPLDEKIKVVIITGTTASGKTSLAVKLAKYFNSEIISADSRQVYKGLDLGTGKDLEEYKREGVKYHLIDILEPNETYALKNFNCDAKYLIYSLHQKGIIPIITGGTISYIDSLLSNYTFPMPPPNYKIREKLKAMPTEEILNRIANKNRELLEKIDDIKNRARVIRYYELAFCSESKEKRKEEYFYNSDNMNFLILGTFCNREEIHNRIKERLDRRIGDGMIREVEELHDKGLSWERLESLGLEYRYISRYLQNKINYQQMYNILLARIRRLARSQDIWFRKLERKGHKIFWLKDNRFKKAVELINNFLGGIELGTPELSIKNIYYGPRHDNKK